MIKFFFYKTVKTRCSKFYAFVRYLLFLQETCTVDHDVECVESRPLYSPLDIYISDEFLIALKSGIHVDSLIKRTFITALNKLNAFSVFFLENFLIQHFFKKIIQFL